MKKVTSIFILIAIIALMPIKATAQAPQQLSQWADSTDAFCADIFGELSTPGTNLLFSPYSISSVLSMTSLGAMGTTKEEMQSVLHCSGENYNSDFSTVIQSLNSVGKFGNVSLNTANAIWVEKGFRLRQRFIDNNRRYYNAGLYTLDFSKNPKKSRKAINDWIAEQTNDKIKDILADGSITPETVMVLGNAVYFYGHWLHEFDKSKTRDASFYPINASEYTTPFMNIEERFRTRSDELMTALEIEYLGEDVSMIIILPREQDGLSKLEANISNLRQWLPVKKIDPARKTNVFIPRFKFETLSNLNGALIALGMESAFDERADFSEIEPEGMLYIDRVVHKAFIEVNEAGTEAAAATVVEMRMKSAMPQPVPEFVADHPFLFVIRHNTTGALLFVGKIERPEE